MIPAHVLEQLDSDANGVLIGRRAKGCRCTDCGSPVLVGLDRDTCAYQATVDPTPISELGEFLAIAAGRTTYDLAIYRQELWRRQPVDITRPRNPNIHSVHARHICGAPPLPIDVTVREGKADYDGECPF